MDWTVWDLMRGIISIKSILFINLFQLDGKNENKIIVLIKVIKSTFKLYYERLLRFAFIDLSG